MHRMAILPDLLRNEAERFLKAPLIEYAHLHSSQPVRGGAGHHVPHSHARNHTPRSVLINLTEMRQGRCELLVRWQRSAVMLGVHRNY